MSILNLDKIFDPHHVAVIGASETPTRAGFTVLRNLLGSGFRGAVYPVHPRRESVQGIEAHPDVASLPHPPDLAVICTPAPGVAALVRQCGEAGTRGIVIISPGFREIGEEGRQREQALLDEQARFPGMRILGPNCLGVIVPGVALNASLAAATPKPGHVAFVSQSGALGASVLDWAIDDGVGFSYFVGVGNMLDVGMADLIDYFGSQTDTQSILLYLESITDAREFMSAARAFSRTRPIVAYKAGRFAESARAAASHTGAMVGVDAVYEAAFQRAGIERVFQLGEMFDVAELLARQQPPQGDRLAILTNAGGPGVMTTDMLIARDGKLAQLSAQTLDKLDQCLPPFWSHGNPVDLLGDAPPERFAKALQIVLADPGVDAVLVLLAPQATTDAAGTASAVAQVASHAHKPVLAAWMGGHSVVEGLRVLAQAGIPAYTTAEKAIAAFMHLVSYSRNLGTLYETPRDLPLSFSLNRDRVRAAFVPILARAGDVLSEDASKSFLEAYEIPVTRPSVARTPDEAVDAARRLGYPVVLKIHSPQISHKTDVGGVILNLGSDEALRLAYAEVMEAAVLRRPDATLLGVTVQKMVTHPTAFELVLGSRKDPVFGAVIMVGSGGVAAEIFRDWALALPPLNESLARRALESLKCWPLLRGYRGRPGANIERLIEVLMRFSYLVADYPEIQEFDVNPLLVTSEDVVALDARLVVDRQAVLHPVRRYAHLAIRPYPEEFVTQRTLKDGTPVTLRPIKPEDEPRWHELLAACSTSSLRFRFRYLFKQTTHEMAARYCFIDYDRELAIVAEVEEHQQQKLIGVARLVADMNHQTAEYAVLVADRWQGRSLGGLLTDYSLEIARTWGVRQIVAEVSKDNARMLAALRSRGFALRHDQEEDVVLGTRSLP